LSAFISLFAISCGRGADFRQQDLVAGPVGLAGSQTGLAASSMGAPF
jgi:hypothetical protein